MSGAPRMAFVLAGGGSLGAVEVGMLQALCEAGIRADFVVGSSAGALNAAFFAGQPDLDGVRRAAQDLEGAAHLATCSRSRRSAACWARWRCATT